MEKFIKEIKDIFDREDYQKLYDSIILQYPNQNNKITTLCKLNDYNFMLKIYCANNIICDIDNHKGQDSPFVESEVLKILNEKFFDRTPCIPFLIHTHKMSKETTKKQIMSIEKCTKERKELCLLWDLLNSGMSKGEPTFILMEAGNISLYQFCKNINTFNDLWVVKSIIWMILNTFKLIRAEYPEFKHGDLFTRNIILYFDNEYFSEDRLGSQFYLNFTGVNIPYVGILPKIIDFEISHLDKNLSSIQKLHMETDDIFQLLFDVFSVFNNQNILSDFINKLLNINFKTGMTYIQCIKKKFGYILKGHILCHIF